jgi:putative transposase
VSINRTIKAIGIAKSTVYYKPKRYPDRKRTPRKYLVKEAKSSIIAITGMKATYGVPRVKAILKRDYNQELSKYMIHRFMKEEGLLITRNRTRGSSRPHTGIISVNESNTRWASDITSIKCWNGQKLRFTYILDCCDRSIIAWKAGFHMQACDIEILLQEAIFNRFGDRLPEKGTLQFLHDNGPEYIEKKLRKSINQWQIEDCNTPTYSPQSNGMCEAFNGTFKRDYVYESCLDNPAIVHNQMQSWIDEYNKFAPHSALNMQTPNEFYNFKSAA